MPLVNDVHSALNETRVLRVVEAGSVAAVVKAVRQARAENLAVAVCGARHAMGGQQFAAEGVLVDLRPMQRVLSWDAGRGLVEVEAGIRWPELMAAYRAIPALDGWGIAQKQTGADRLSLGGTLAANGHGRGLTMRPFVADVEAVALVDAAGETRRCSRVEEPELFSLVAGGYGLCGIVTSLTLRLAPRRKLERVVAIGRMEGLLRAFEERIRDGFLYGDFQFSIDERSAGFLDEGVFSCYRPVAPETPIPAAQRELSDDDWRELLWLAHADKAKAFERYAGHYLASSGQIYESDTHQLSPYFDGYHNGLDTRLERPYRASEIITEIYVPRPRLADFMAEAAEGFRRHGTEVIYGTVRLIERDTESFLTWAREPWACVIFNLCTPHTPAGLEGSAAAFRRLIDLAVARGGSYFLTYHRFARRDQVEACHPQLRGFLRRKRELDPEERFQSDWYRHLRRMFQESA